MGYHTSGKVLYTSGTGHVRENGRSVVFKEGEQVKRERMIGFRNEFESRNRNHSAILIKKQVSEDDLPKAVDGKYTSGVVRYWFDKENIYLEVPDLIWYFFRFWGYGKDDTHFPIEGNTIPINKIQKKCFSIFVSGTILIGQNKDNDFCEKLIVAQVTGAVTN